MTNIRKLWSVLLCFAMILGLFPLTVVAAEYSSCKSGTVSWQMISDNPNTYYWVDSENEYCVLTAVKSGKKYYVTLYRTKKGDELRYLKQDKDDDSGSEKEWDSAKTVYTGGVLYKKTTSGGGSSSGTTVADGTYTATSSSSYKKDGETYKATVKVTVSGGKVTALTATGPTSSSDNKSYFNKALSGIQSKIIGQTATTTVGDNVDTVSKATNSSKLIKEAINLAMQNAPSGGGSDTPVSSGLADGTYTATSSSTYKKDGETYSATVKITISNGKITSLTATGPTSSSDNKSYFNKALSGIQSKLVGQTATKDSGNNVDTVSKATNSSKLIKEAITLALAKAPSSGGSDTKNTYTVTWKNYDGTTLETDKNVTEGTKPSYNSAVPTRDADSQYAYTFAGWTTSSYQTSGTAADNLPAVSGNVTYYAAFAKNALVTMADGLYGDKNAIVYKYNYIPVVTVTVKNNIIISVSGDADTNDVNLEFFNEALYELQSRLVGQPVSAALALQENTDAVSGATFASNAIIADIKSALAQSPKGNCIVIWKNYDGSILKSNSVAYGSTTVTYNDTPVRPEDDSYTYTFKGWNPKVSKIVTENAVYTAEYISEEKAQPEPAVADGFYGDNTAVVYKYNYKPVVTITVKNGTVVSLTSNADTNDMNLVFLQEALEGLESRIVGKSVALALALDENTDTVSGATFASNAIIADIKSALAQSPKGNFTVVWKNDDGSVLKTDTTAYGSETAVYNGTPVKNETEDYIYTFKNWSPSVSKLVTANAVYTAQYTAQEKEKPIPVFDDGKYIDGTGYVPFGYNTVVKVTVKNSIIQNIDVTSKDVGSHTYYLNTAKTWIQNQLIGKTANAKLLDDIDTISGATATKKVVLESVDKALNAESVISWTDDNGNLLDTAKISDNTMPEYDGDEPSKTGYNFIGWTPTIHTVSGDQTYKTVFEQKAVEYTVTYDSVSDSHTYQAGDTVTVTLNVPQKDGYHFDGWSLDGRKLTDNTFTMPARNVILKAIWKEWYNEGIYGDDSITESILDTYQLVISVSVNDNNQIIDVIADTDEDKSILTDFGFDDALEYVNQELMYEDISIENLERVYYASNPDLGSDAPIFASDIIAGVIEALKHTPKDNYTVTVKNTDGTIEKTYPNIRYGTRTEDILEVPVKQSNEQYTYTFKGWKESLDTFVTDNAVYTAQFNEKVNRFIVTWKNYDGTVLKKDIAEYGSLPVYSGSTPQKTSTEYYDYIFTGWDKELSEVTQNTEYTAVFEQKIAKELTNHSQILTSSPKLGESIAVKALAVGGEGGYSYAVYYKRTSVSTWTTCSSWTNKTEFAVTPTAAVSYDICVKVKDISGTIVKKYFTVDVENTFDNLSTISAETIRLGDSIQVSAAAKGGLGNYQYAVFYKSKSASQWTTVSSWTSQTEFAVTPKSVTQYDLCVKVKDKNGIILKKFFDIDVTSSFVNTSVINAQSIHLGDSINITASAEGGFGDYQYSVYYKSESVSQWTTVFSWTDKTEFAVTPKAVTKYNVCVKVKDGNGSIAKKYFDVDVTSSFINTSTISADTVNKGDSVQLFASAQGGFGNYQYSVYYKSQSKSQWTTYQSWTTETVFTLPLPSAVIYNICVKVKDQNGTIAKQYFDVTVKDPALKNQSSISAEKITVGDSVTFTALALDGQGTYQYAVYYKKTQNTTWKTLSNWSETAVSTLNFTESGTYNACIKVKDQDGTIEKKYFVITVTE